MNDIAQEKQLRLCWQKACCRYNGNKRRCNFHSTQFIHSVYKYPICSHARLAKKGYIERKYSKPKQEEEEMLTVVTDMVCSDKDGTHIYQS